MSTPHAREPHGVCSLWCQSFAVTCRWCLLNTSSMADLASASSGPWMSSRYSSFTYSVMLSPIMLLTSMNLWSLIRSTMLDLNWLAVWLISTIARTPVLIWNDPRVIVCTLQYLRASEFAWNSPRHAGTDGCQHDLIADRFDDLLIKDARDNV